MMTLDELQASAINPNVAREAYEQTSKRLEDILDSKKTFEQKAFTLFSGYLTVCIVLLGVAGSRYASGGISISVVAFGLAGCLLAAGSICFVLALMDETYGTLGSSPDMWLVKGVIDGPDTALTAMLAYITHHYRVRMDVSIVNNNKKARRIRTGIFLGIAAPLVMTAVLLIPITIQLQAFLQQTINIP